MSDFKIYMWSLMGTWAFIFVLFYIICDTNHQLNQHIEQTQIQSIEHSSLEEMLGPTHQVYITIQTTNDRDTATVSKSK